MKEKCLLLVIILQSALILGSVQSDSSGSQTESSFASLEGALQPISDLEGQMAALDDDESVRFTRSDTNITSRQEAVSCSGLGFESEGSEKSFKLPNPPIPRIGGAWLRIQSSEAPKKKAFYTDWFKTGSGFALLGLPMNRLPVLSTQSTDTRKK